ncbi:MAG: tetratricopeptide repeat protein [Anaerobacillus sp.]|uniref:tetratricopeptide repeat protein n=1 Tax=Anaerobacillus sp. TaxID=1872506 RepID=UPI00391DD6A9
MNKSISKKMSLAIITFIILVVVSSGLLILKIVLWNDYDVTTYYEKDYRKSMETIKKDPNDLQARLSLLEGFYRKNQFEDAEVQIEYIVENADEQFPHLNKVKYYRALLNAKKGDFDKAIEDFSEIVKTDVTNGDAWLSLGHVYYSIGEYERSIEAVSVAEELLKTSAEPIYLKSLILFVNGEFDTSQILLERALSIDPLHLNSQELLSRIVER